MKKYIILLISFFRRSIFICGISFFILHFSFSIAFAGRVKEPNVAGTFYPSDADELSSRIEEYLKDAGPVSLEGEPLVLIVPHAGYVYSGPVAAYAYKVLQGKSFDLVVVLAASHFYPFRGASGYGEGFFRTPLGLLEVDSEAAGEFLDYGQGLIVERPGYFEREHSIEVELPFLQKVLPAGFKILPIVMGEMTYEQCGELAGALVRLSQTRRVLVVASTDLSHYKSYQEAQRYDSRTVDFLKAMDSRGLWDSVAGSGWNVCGVRPVVTSLLYAKKLGEEKMVILKYANSADTAGTRDRVVGYVSAAVVSGEKAPGIQKSDPRVQEQDRNDGEDDMLTDSDKKRLLEIARQTIRAQAAGDPLPAFHETSPGLNLKRGVFVTLHQKGALRGCIGLFSSDRPLYQSVQEMAVEASSRDYRFAPVRSQEVPELVIEISVLTEPELLGDWHKVRLGTDGVIVRKGSSSGVFLPQVAGETGWDKETFLGELCRQKAGLPPDSYKDPGTRLYVFQAIIFSEEK